ncbi:MAG: alpha-2-macroglobulin [Kangiellaceae bacterium]
MNRLFAIPRNFLIALLGRFSWVAPDWLRYLGSQIQRNPKSYLLAALLIVGGLITKVVLENIPQPPKILATISQIYPTPDYDDAEPSNLYVSFAFESIDQEQQASDNSDAYEHSVDEQQNQFQPELNEPVSVARIDLMDRVIDTGIKLTPHKSGRWRWLEDNQLIFVPETDWPAGIEYQVEFERSIFSPETELKTNKYLFSTPKMQLSFENSQFYQDPKNSQIRKVVTTINFTHPVDKQSLESKIKLYMPDTADKETHTKNYQYEINYSKNLRQASIHSEPIKLPKSSNYMHVSIAEGVASLLGGTSTIKEVSTKVKVPDIYSFLKVESLVQILRNPKDEPEQVVMLSFTDDISIQEMRQNLEIYLLPRQGQKSGKSRWQSPRQISHSVLADSELITYRLLENPRDNSRQYNVVIDIPQNRYIYLKLSEGFSSVNGFVHQQQYDSVLRVSNYPKEVKIVGEGSILSYSGNHKLSVLSRGLSALRYRIAQVKKDQLHHLVSQTEGDIRDPQFSGWNFDEKNLANIYSAVVPLNRLHPKQANYSSFDLSQYLTDPKNQYGLFVIDIQGYDMKRKRVVYGANERRLVLITDLGVIVKNNLDSTHNLFVQSVSQGKPVANASVEILSRNGSSVFSGVTNADGHVAIPNTEKLRDEKQPVVYVVTASRDTSFIPFDRYSRQLQLSRFDVGGVYSNQYAERNLNSFLFTDRGIYRPGETVNLGIITKAGQLENIENIPVELVIRGPRYNEVRVKKLRLGSHGLNDFQFQTMATSDTGDYTATLHLVRDNRRRGIEIGNTRFKVEEFQPDTMKIESQLLEVANKGWTNQQKVKARVSLKNLFGIPAQGRNVSAKVNIEPVRFQFKDFSDYQFNQVNLDNESSLTVDTNLPQKKTDDDGEVEFEVDLSRFSQGTYRVNFSAEGFEPSGGRSVFARSSALVSHYESLLGFKTNGRLDYINRDSQRALDFIAIDKKLEKINHDELTLAIFEIQKVSSLVQQANGTYQYQTISKEVEQARQAFKVEKGGSRYSLNTNKPGDFSLVIYDELGRTITKVYYSVVGAANMAGKIDKSAELVVKLNKTDYKPGDIVEMNIRAPYAGAGLITVETDRVLNYEWFNSSQESSVQRIRLPKDIEGNGYINVTYVRDASSTEIFTNPLSYAVEPFSIDRSQRRIDIALKTDSIVRPGKPMSIHYQSSKPAKMIVFAVDEGILQVAKYGLPNPLNHYLQKRALGVETYQMLDLLLPDFNILQQMSAAGGGYAERSLALAKNINPFTRKTDKPAVFWSGIVESSTQNKQLEFDIPDTFSGQLRVMAVAVGKRSVGAAKTSSIVRGPFVISPNVLTHASPGDEFEVTVGVANIVEGSGKKAKITLSASSSEHLEIKSQKASLLEIDEGSEGKATFKVVAKSKLGSAELSFTAKLGEEELTRSASLSVRPATHFATVIKTGFSNDTEKTIDDIRKTFEEFSQRSVSASNSPLVLVDGLHDYLQHYPHGCTEQVVSKVFPLVGLMSHQAYAAYLGDVRTQFSVVINKLRERQKADGGFAFWPSHSGSASYPSIYVTHFLLEASEQGYPVPKDMLTAAQRYLNEQAARSASNDSSRHQPSSNSSNEKLAELRDRANAIYLLTRMGTVTTNYLIDLEDDLKKLQSEQWKFDLLASYMAATYQMLQKDEEAARLISYYQLIDPKRNQVNRQTVRYGDFHSPLALDSQHLYLLSKHFKPLAKAIDASIIHGFTQHIIQGEYNTISAAYSILALGAYSELVQAGVMIEKLTIAASSNEGQSFETLDKLKAAFNKSEFPIDTQQLQLASDKAFYFLTNQSGFDLVPTDKPIREGLEIDRVFLDQDGNQVQEFTQGQELTVKIRVRSLSQRTITNVAIVDLLPGGFEVIRSSVERAANRWSADHVDVREDRVIFYGPVETRIRELSYRVKLTAAGEFVVPSTSAEAMYDRSVRAVTGAATFQVKPSK